MRNPQSSTAGRAPPDARRVSPRHGFRIGYSLGTGELGKFIAWLFLRLTGWRMEGEVPTHARYVLVAAPHTTNWDLPYTLAIGFFAGLRVHWIGKHTLFRRPFGTLMRALGGIAIDRRISQNMVEQVVARFRESARLIIVIPPEGTRGGGERYWKSGFYHIARGAEVPIVLGFLDYRRRRGGFGPTISLSGDVAGDMERLRGFYAGVVAKHPDKFRTPRLRDEDGAPAAVSG